MKAFTTSMPRTYRICLFNKRRSLRRPRSGSAYLGLPASSRIFPHLCRNHTLQIRDHRYFRKVKYRNIIVAVHAHTILFSAANVRLEGDYYSALTRSGCGAYSRAIPIRRETSIRGNTVSKMYRHRKETNKWRRGVT